LLDLTIISTATAAHLAQANNATTRAKGTLFLAPSNQTKLNPNQTFPRLHLLRVEDGQCRHNRLNGGGAHVRRLDSSYELGGALVSLPERLAKLNLSKEGMQ
jgi:hypothetical protein